MEEEIVRLLGIISSRLGWILFFVVLMVLFGKNG